MIIGEPIAGQSFGGQFLKIPCEHPLLGGAAHSAFEFYNRASQSFPVASKMSETSEKHQRTLERFARTKTVVTVGPACSSRGQLASLIQAGASIFRLNMAHGDRATHEEVIGNIRSAAETTGVPCGILIDLAGPKIRLGTLFSEPMVIENGQTLFFVRGERPTAENELTCQYSSLIDEVKPGDAIVLADGLARLEVVGKTADRVECLVIDGGTIRSRQGVNLPGTDLSVPALGEKDIDNAIWAAAQQVDFVSLSFVREAAEIEQLGQLLKEQGSEAVTISKIEKREALENLESIVAASGGIMVARGDLGVEVDIWKTPLAQKRIIRVCLEFRKPVIVATQMLESMHSSKLPTRAEVSDVANAILDGADACMLSGETAIGQYPVESVDMMNKIMVETETSFKGRSSTIADQMPPSGWTISEAVVLGAAQIARRVGARLVVIASTTGESALVKSKQRDFVPTICLSDSQAILNRMALYWGVMPVLVPSLLDTRQLREFIDVWAKGVGNAQCGDPVVIVADTELLPGVHDNVMVTRVR